MQTIVERFGWPKVLVGACAVGLLAGGIKAEISHSDGPPSCAKSFVGTYDGPGGDALGEYMNKMVECGEAVDKWCAKNHPENPEDCSNNIDIDGDARNVGKN
jgi:hypothetical protein